MKILTVAPHPDDEVLGMGGTIHRLVGDGHEVVVAIATRGWAPLFDESQVARVQDEARAAAKVLGVSHMEFMNLPVTRLHGMERHELNTAFDELVRSVEPAWVFLPFPGDRHEDHRQVFDACMVALRPLADREFVRRIMCYETVSETHWAAPGLEPDFSPQVHVEISAHLEAKLEAMACYESQVRPAPDARSLEAVRALAQWRGSVVSLPAAEGFVLIRERI